MQAPYVSCEEINRVVDYVKANYGDELLRVDFGGSTGERGETDELDPRFIEALRVVIKENKVSISLIQRKCGLGYNKAGQIMEWMEENGYVSPFDGVKARKVLITKAQFEEKYGKL